MIDIICSYKVFCILSALVIGVAILFGLVLGYQICKAKEQSEKEAEQPPEDAYNEQFQRDISFLKQYLKEKERREAVGNVHDK